MLQRDTVSRRSSAAERATGVILPAQLSQIKASLGSPFLVATKGPVGGFTVGARIGSYSQTRLLDFR